MSHNRKYSDQELTVFLRNGDRWAFTEIYNLYMEPLYLYAYNFLKDEHEAEDIIHELFFTLWENASQLQLKNTLSAYLYRAVKNKVFNTLDHRKIKDHYLESLQGYIDQGHRETDESIQLRELTAQIENEVSHLPGKMREIFQLSRDLGLSHKDIASQLGISDKTVKKQINNAIKILRLKLNMFFIVFF